MRNTVVNIELLPPIVEAFAQCPFCLHTTRNVDVFSLCAVVEESVSGSLVGPRTASSAHRASHTHPPSGDHLLICTLARNVGVTQ